MNCLCCGKPLPEGRGQNGWHEACVKRFFGTKQLPELWLNEETLAMLAAQSVAKGYTVAGVQKKLSLHLSKEDTPRLTLVGYPAGYILKPQVADYPYMPEGEQLVMCMADTAGITTVPHALIRQANSVAYITKRIDRRIGENHLPCKLAMEDFCQLDRKPTEEKYHGSYERCAKIIRQYSRRSGFDLTELFMRLVFCFLTGNSDMHLKNFSLIETEAQSAQYQLAPAYDLLPVQLYLPSDREDTALVLNGKNQHIRRKDLLSFADTIGIPRKGAEGMIGRMTACIPKWQSQCRESLLPAEHQQKLLALLDERADRILA